MDDFIDARDYRLLEGDRYTFFVLRRVMGGPCQLLLSDHERLILCYTCEPYPVWIWTADHAPEEVLERAYRLLSEHSLLRRGQRFNVKYELAAYLIRRAAEDGIGLKLYENMFAYGCPDPIPPSAAADGGLHRCTEADLDTLAEIMERFANETGLDQKSRARYREGAKASIDAGKTYFWKNELGQTAACCKYVPNGEMASVSLVYTFPEHRRKHCAENLVYRVTMLAKAEGWTPMLYTNADYAASNACYRKIGYTLRGKLCSVAVT